MEQDVSQPAEGAVPERGGVGHMAGPDEGGRATVRVRHLRAAVVRVRAGRTEIGYSRGLGALLKYTPSCYSGLLDGCSFRFHDTLRIRFA